MRDKFSNPDTLKILNNFLLTQFTPLKDLRYAINFGGLHQICFVLCCPNCGENVSLLIIFLVNITDISIIFSFLNVLRVPTSTKIKS